MPTFSESLTMGKTSEMIALEYLRIRNPSAMLIEGKCKEADIIVFGETNTLFECKQDWRSDETNNWAVEISMGGVDSGLITTRSDVWILMDHTHMHFIKPIQILRCIAKNQFPIKSWVGPGDYKSKLAYLIPKNILAEYIMYSVPIPLAL